MADPKVPKLEARNNPDPLDIVGPTSCKVAIVENYGHRSYEG